MMRWSALLLALCALLTAGQAGTAQETVFRVEYHSDPCQAAAAYGKDKQASVGGLSVSLETFYYAACERVREQVVDSITARLQQLRSDLEGEALNRVRPIYDGFVTWLSLELYDRLSEADKAAADAGAAFPAVAEAAGPGTGDLRQLLLQDPHAAGRRRARLLPGRVLARDRLRPAGAVARRQEAA